MSDQRPTSERRARREPVPEWACERRPPREQAHGHLIVRGTVFDTWHQDVMMAALRAALTLDVLEGAT